MKTKNQFNFLSLLMLFASSFLFACKNGIGTSDMTGTYVNHAGGEYSVADDTLVVEHEQKNRFLIHRRTGFNLIREGKKGKREYETEEWKAIYDPKTEVMTETRRGKTITFYGDKMIVGSREYKKPN
ncbi:hypothetical protein [Pedobacter helvus]|uniref:Lipoprotein n=1 Tax=Pedobacter helvus TaxID=2563444 RepID=A0ABW9JNV3_9SPHI|nr:hypothetical protein [Pedobacter ureilyticus]